MKRRILSASDKLDPEAILAELVRRASSCGYDMSVDENFNVTLESKDGDNMPTIEVTTIKEDDEDTYNFDVTLKFPELTSEDSSYYDDIEYYLTKWAKIGPLMTKFLEKSIHLSDYVE